MNGAFQTIPQIAHRGVSARGGRATADPMGELTAAFDRLAETLNEQSDERRPKKESVQETSQEWLEVLSRFSRRLKNYYDIPSIRDLLIATVEDLFPDYTVTFGSEQDRGPMQSEPDRTRDAARVPLIAEGMAWGTLSLFAKENRTLGRFELQFLTLLADEAASAMHQARLHQIAKAQQLELQEAKKALTHAHTSKSDFLSIMSHEFRTPLSLIMGYTEIMQEELAGNITVEQSGYLQRIMTASEDILALVLSVLHVGSIESGSVELNEREVGLGALLEELRSDLTLPRKNGVDFVWDVPADLPIVTTDGEKLKHVLYRLIDNAVKFTEHGQVRISSKMSVPLRQVEVTVSDTGVGIPGDALIVMFEKYRQLDGSIARMHDGMGLGLFIAKKLTEILGGKLDVASEPGKGSTFTVALPVAV